MTESMELLGPPQSRTCARYCCCIQRGFGRWICCCDDGEDDGDGGENGNGDGGEGGGGGGGEGGGGGVDIDANMWRWGRRRRHVSPQRRRLVRVVRSRGFEIVVAVVLMCNAGFVFRDIGTEGQGTYAEDVWSWEAAELCFSLTYALEMWLKIRAFGCGRYWRHPLNAYDGTITIISGVGELYIFWPNGYNDPSLVRYVLIARLLRLLRLLSVFPGFRLIFGTARRIIPTFGTFIGMLWCIISAFAAAGVTVFGGQVHLNSTVLAGMVKTGAFPDTYYYMNFNDFPSSILTLFTLLIVNNWFLVMDGVVAVTGTQWSRAYFVFFYVVGVMMALNLVLAIILEGFQAETEATRALPAHHYHRHRRRRHNHHAGQSRVNDREARSPSAAAAATAATAAKEEAVALERNDLTKKRWGKLRERAWSAAKQWRRRKLRRIARKTRPGKAPQRKLWRGMSEVFEGLGVKHSEEDDAFTELRDQYKKGRPRRATVGGSGGRRRGSRRSVDGEDGGGCKEGEGKEKSSGRRRRRAVKKSHSVRAARGGGGALLLGVAGEAKE